jgi:hypothetical protein
MSVSQDLAELENLLDGKELIVTDFAHTLIEGDKYTREAAKFLAKHGWKKILKKTVKERTLSDAKKGYRIGKNLVSNRNEMPPEIRTREILEIIKDVDEGVGKSFGETLSKYIDQNVLNFLLLCYNVNDRIQRALVSIDGHRTVEPTLYKLDTTGLPIHKYIVNQVVAVGGKFTDMLISYTEGVLNWSGKAIWTAQDKLDAFMAVTHPYHPSQVIYINDDAKQEEKIDQYMNKNGGTILKGYDLGKFIAPTLI